MWSEQKTHTRAVERPHLEARVVGEIRKIIERNGGGWSIVNGTAILPGV